ncbi:MAG: GNAT family N-acetyltransferase [Xanthomonadaceae bacterium]|nr:GNAT family N-acetyltransferase [Xanthomonadaceae bacterium]MDE1961362.1 GNAT family N-acetyltransferase [Xanthomonadaceae bacterium]MDE2083317.1 GNAT family N-acetyltransferase [Xanthomonadaceae bacterium]MDE2257520.1 GNAT family N-acetyltransferase [Xanthomonadaceae bacterium]
MRSDPPRIETARLILRQPAAADFEGYAQMFADADNVRHIGGQLARGAAWRRFLQMPGAWMVQGFAMFSVIDKASGEWLGQAGPWQPDGWPGSEVGWSFRRSAWGQGYAREAATASIDWAFANLGWTDVIHCIDSENAPSQALATRLGSRILRRTNLPAPFEDAIVDVWGQTREEWFARRSELS